MPVKHDLFEDLKLSKEEFDQRKKTDDRLIKLMEAYSAIDADVVQAENNSASDDEVKKLKEKRLLAKDKIVQQLEYPNSRGAAQQF